MQPGIGLLEYRYHPRQVEKSGTERHFRQQEPVRVGFHSHILDVRALRVWSERLYSIHRVVEQRDIVAEVQADTEILTRIGSEQTLQFFQSPVFVILNRKSDLLF